MWYIRARVQQGKRTHTHLDCFYSWTLEADLLSKAATFHWRLSFIAQICFWILKGKYAFPHYSFIMYMKVETPKSLWNGRTMWLHKYSYSAYIRFEGNRLFWNTIVKRIFHSWNPCNSEWCPCFKARSLCTCFKIVTTNDTPVSTSEISLSSSFTTSRWNVHVLHIWRNIKGSKY